MRRIKGIARRLVAGHTPLYGAALALLALAPVSHAGTPGGVILGPASATAVPTLTPSTLIALGVVLAVIALRVLRQNGGAQKIVSIALLGSGALLGGFGVERTLATSAATLADATCETATINVSFGNLRGFNSSENTVNNQCGRDLQVVEYTFTCGQMGTFNDNGAPVGTVIPDGAEQSMGYCEMLQPPP
tara:strand:- start:20065 stop:20634 length:570 start_codon:yes stop_codon:yes gene_type:complete